MRIAYISLHWPRTRNNSVGRKIQRQINAWQIAGHDVRFFMHTLRHEPAEEFLPGEVFPYAVANKLHRELSRIDAARRLVKAVRAFDPDLIYLRYGIYVYPVHGLVGIAPLVVDVTANDLVQHQEWGKLYEVYNRITRGILLRRAAGLVSISRELAVSPVFANYKKPTVVIANGITLDDFQPLPAPANEKPRLIFVGSPTAGFAGHGVDKLAVLAELCPDLHIDVIGYKEFPESRPVPASLAFHGYLHPDTYRALLANADVAISSLGFHRVGLEEASPLKSREYLAYGLPMVVPYADTDLDDLDCDCFLKIPNREDNIRTHAELIRDFAYRMRGRRVERSLITSRIDTHFKEQKRLAFFEQIVSVSRK